MKTIAANNPNDAQNTQGAHDEQGMPPSSPASNKAKLLALITIVITASCLGSLSQTAMNAMFASVAPDFGVEVDLGQLVTTLYMLVLGVTVPLVTYLMRRFSLKRLIVASIVLLCAGALVDLVAQSFVMLVAGRVLQAISAGILMPMMMSVVMISYPPERQATVMGVAGIAMGFAPNIGPTIGGIMVTSFGWRSFFVALLTLSVLLVVLALLLIDSGKAPSGQARLDVFSFVLSALAFGMLLCGFTNASTYSFASWLVWIPLIIGAVAMTWFVLRQRRIAHPLIDMRIFSSAKFRVSFWATNALFASFMGITLILPLFIEECWGGTALEGGFTLLPGTIAALFLNPLSGWLTDRIGVRPVALIGTTCLAVGATSLAFIDETTPFWLIMTLQGIRACGVSSLIAPLSSWGMSELSHEIVVDASSFSTAARQACASMGTALMVFGTTLAASLGSVAASYHLAFGISAALSIFMWVLCIARVRS